MRKRGLLLVLDAGVPCGGDGDCGGPCRPWRWASRRWSLDWWVQQFAAPAQESTYCYSQLEHRRGWTLGVAPSPAPAQAQNQAQARALEQALEQGAREAASPGGSWPGSGELATGVGASSTVDRTLGLPVSGGVCKDTAADDDTGARDVDRSRARYVNVVLERRAGTVESSIVENRLE